MSPTNADSGRGELFRAYLTSRGSAYTAALGVLATFTWGAWQRDALTMAGGPLAVAVLVVAASFVLADRAAERRFFSSYAAGLGLVYLGRASLTPLTPLLGAGHRRHCENWMQGALPGEPGVGLGLGHMVWEVQEMSSDGRRQGAKARYRFTACVVDMEPSISLFHGVFVRPRRGVIAPYPDWLGDVRTRRMELESSAFSQRYELLLASDQDELAARKLFSPTLLAWLAEHPLGAGFELRAGMLVTYVDRGLTDEGNLTWLIDVTRRLSARVRDEVAEAAARPAAARA